MDDVIKKNIFSKIENEENKIRINFSIANFLCRTIHEKKKKRIDISLAR